jgi:hypothetical protein
MPRVALAVGALLIVTGCGGERILEQIPPGGEDITVNVLSCNFDATTGLASAGFELTSEQEYRTVLLRGELSDESGIVIGTGTGSATDLKPGTPYRDEMVFSLSSEPEGEVSCNVAVDLANPAS